MSLDIGGNFDVKQQNSNYIIKNGIATEDMKPNLLFNYNVSSDTLSNFHITNSTDISGDIDTNGDGKITQEEIMAYVDALNEMNEPQKTEKGEEKNEEESSYDSVMNLTEEEISQMSGEELAELLHSAINDVIFNSFSNDSSLTRDKFTSGNMNAIRQNAMLFSLINKMSDEQLKDFLDAYKENYPRKTGDNSFDLAGYENLADGALWGGYSISAGLIDRDEANSALDRLKDFFPGLRPDVGSGGFKQWL